MFCHQLLSSNVELLADAAMGVANMTKLLPSAVRMSDTNIIEALCGNESIFIIILTTHYVCKNVELFC